MRFPFRVRRRKSPFNNVSSAGLTCGQVTPLLWVGGELGPLDWAALRQAGVSALVNLQQEQQDVFAPDEAVGGYLWLPAPDGEAPSLAQLSLGVSFIRSATAGGAGVFVHCKAGQGRAPLLCACYLLTLGHTPLSALELLTRARPRVALTPVQNAQLREFAAALTRSQQARAVREENGAPPAAVPAGTHEQL